MYKVIHPSGFAFNQPSAVTIKNSSRGVRGYDRSQLEKTASVSILENIDELCKQAQAGDELVHLLALGATETTGINRNGDGFKAAACRRTHDTFVKYAYNFRDHQNKDPKVSFGRPIMSSYNENMGRVELICRLNGTKEAADRNGGLVADRELNKLFAGKDLAVSMAAKVPFDLCSYCGNQSPTVKHYCKGEDEGGHCKAGGLSSHIGSVVEVDGDMHHLHADNPDPRFFDISDVYRPADRTAYAFGLLQKRAGAQIIKSAELAEAWGIKIPTNFLTEFSKEAGYENSDDPIAKMAAVEQNVESGAMLNSYASAFLKSDADPGNDAWNNQLLDASIDPVKTAQAKEALLKHNVLLPLPEFLTVFGGLPYEKAASVAAVVQSQLPGIYQRMCFEGKTFEGYAAAIKTAGEKVARLSNPFDSWASKMASRFSIDRPAINRRTIRAAIQLKENPVVKQASHLQFAEDAAARVASEYALYKLAFVQATADPFMAHMSVLQDYV